jgi:MSHA biogenesis protein MshI
MVWRYAQRVIMSLFFKAKRRPGWLAVNVMPQQIDVAHIARIGAQRPQVLISDSYRKEGSDAATLERLRKELELGQYRCTTLLKNGDYQVLQIEAPNVAQDEIKAAAGWKVKDLIDYPIERAAIEVLTIPGASAVAGRPAAMFAVAARDETVKNRINLFEAAEIPLEAIDIPELAQRNISALLETEGRALGMLGFDSQGGLLTITQGGELLLSRYLDVTLSQLVEAAEERRLQLLERVGLELQRSLDFFDRQPNSVALTKLLVPALPPGTGMLEYLASNLSVPVELLNLDSVLDFTRVPALRDPQRQGQCLQMLGAALRDDARSG